LLTIYFIYASRHGAGNWKLILMSNKTNFVGRTQVDLKDKWRNIEQRYLL
jgi:hypothetical protein